MFVKLVEEIVELVLDFCDELLAIFGVAFWDLLVIYGVYFLIRV